MQVREVKTELFPRSSHLLFLIALKYFEACAKSTGLVKPASFCCTFVRLKLSIINEHQGNHKVYKGKFKVLRICKPCRIHPGTARQNQGENSIQNWHKAGTELI